MASFSDAKRLIRAEKMAGKLHLMHSAVVVQESFLTAKFSLQVASDCHLKSQYTLLVAEVLSSPLR